MGRILWTCALVLPLAACGAEAPDRGGRETERADPKVRLVKAEAERVRSPDVTDEQVAELVGGNNDFAFEMYHEQAGTGNLVFSPYSISLAFSLAYAGARGETEAQMAETLKFLPQETQHRTSTPSRSGCPDWERKAAEAPARPSGSTSPIRRGARRVSDSSRSIWRRWPNTTGRV